jgi:hypothetical protein
MGADFDPNLVTDAVAMPGTSTTQPLDGSSVTTASMTAPDNTIIPAGSYVNVSDAAWVITYPDGSSRIIYKNQPIVDPECVNYDTAQINAGKVCAYNVGVPNKPDYFEYRYIPTERWTGNVQSAGELRANMARVVALNPKFPDSARWNIYYNNPSWHGVLNGDLTKLASYDDDYLPTYIGPTTTSGGNTMYVVDPDSGEHIDVTDQSKVTPEQDARITDIVYGPVPDRAPGQPGYVPPVYSGPPIDATGSVIHDDDAGSAGGGNGIPRSPGGTPGVTTTLNVAPAAGLSPVVIIGLGALALLFLRKR